MGKLDSLCSWLAEHVVKSSIVIIGVIVFGGSYLTNNTLYWSINAKDVIDLCVKILIGVFLARHFTRRNNKDSKRLEVTLKVIDTVDVECKELMKVVLDHMDKPQPDNCRQITLRFKNVDMLIDQVDRINETTRKEDVDLLRSKHSEMNNIVTGDERFSKTTASYSQYEKDQILKLGSEFQHRCIELRVNLLS